MRKMTKAEALRDFRENIAPAIRAEYGNDSIALSQEWANYTDRLCTEGRITREQDSKWTNPY